MSYSLSVQHMVIPVEIDVDGSTGVKFSMKPKTAITVIDFGFCITTEVMGSPTTNPIISLGYTVSGGSRVAKALCTPADADAVGTMVAPATAITEFDVATTGMLDLKLDTAAAGGTTTGKGHGIIYFREEPS